MSIVVWIVEGTWPACIDAAQAQVQVRAEATEATELTLLHVTDSAVAGIAHNAYTALLGRGHRAHDQDPGALMEHLADTAAHDLLDAAAARLQRPCTRVARTGRPEREVVQAADGADLLILARDGDRSRLGPRSLGHHTRFVVDHAPCPVLLVWPEPAPGLTTIPPPPHHGPH